MLCFPKRKECSWEQDQARGREGARSQSHSDGVLQKQNKAMKNRKTHSTNQHKGENANKDAKEDDVLLVSFCFFLVVPVSFSGGFSMCTYIHM
jgi:nitrate reductase NapE component